MASTTFSGPVTSQNGFVGAVTTTQLTATGTTNVFVVPTVDPGVAGALWNNAGTLAVSAG